MTDDEIDAAVDAIFDPRLRTHGEMKEWFRMSFRCLHCRPYAAKFQKRIRDNDLEICKANEPLTKL